MLFLMILIIKALCSCHYEAISKNAYEKFIDVMYEYCSEHLNARDTVLKAPRPSGHRRNRWAACASKQSSNLLTDHLITG